MPFAGDPVVVSDVGSGFIERVIYEANATFTKASYPTARLALVRVQAGGGGGGGAQATAAGNCAAGSGGGSGGYSESWLTVSTLAASVTVTHGTGGAGNSGANGSAGGNASFGPHVTANGGSGGNVGVTGTSVLTTNSVGGGAEGIGDIAIQGGTSPIAARLGTAAGQVMSSPGGNAFMGAGGFAGRNFAGGPGGGYGGGGGGASNDPSQSARAGGAGAAGIIIVDLYT